MSAEQKQFTSIQQCEHCGIRTPMEVIVTHRREHPHDPSLPSQDSCTVYEMLICPICEEVILRQYDWDSPSPKPADIHFQTLYPRTESPPAKVSESFRTSYATARHFRKIDPIAYGIMLGHLSVIRECNRKKRI